MRKFLILFVLFTALFSVNTFAADIFINGKDSFCDGIILNGRVMVPVRSVFEKLGYTVTWNKDTETALLVNNTNKITIRNGSSFIYVNAKAIKPDVPQMIINGSMYIPLRAVSEAISADVSWDNNNKTVYITTAERIVTLNEISKCNTLESILNTYSSVTINNTYKSVKGSDIAQNYEVSFGKDDNGNFIYTYSDSSGLKRLMCYDGEFSISPDGKTSSVFFKNDEERNNSIMNCYNFIDSNMMIANSENGTILSLNTFKDYYKADVTIVMDISSPTYGIWAAVWGITDKKFDICYEYLLDKNTLAVTKSDIFCSLSTGRFDAGSTTQTYNKKITIPPEFKKLIENGNNISA